MMILGGVANQQAMSSDPATPGMTIDPSWFVFTVDAGRDDSGGTGTVAGQFKIPSTSSNYQIRWEEVADTQNSSDGAVQVSSANHIIDFGSSGVFRVAIDPVTNASNFTYFRFNNIGDKLKVVTLAQWGTTDFFRVDGMFYGCSNMAAVNTTDSPDFSNVYNDLCGTLFMNCSSLASVSGVGSWDMSAIKDFNGMFRGCSLLNPDVSSWNTGSATNLGSMFFQAYVAAPDVSAWDVSSVTDMSYMFRQASAANPDTSLWLTSALTNTRQMFYDSGVSSQSFAHFDMSDVTNADAMFLNKTLSVAHYDATLAGWAGQPLQSGVAFGGGQSKYSATGATSRSTITSAPNNWTITDGGPE